jgi:hypothetical protein
VQAPPFLLPVLFGGQPADPVRVTLSFAERLDGIPDSQRGGLGGPVSVRVGIKLGEQPVPSPRSKYSH